MFTNTYEGKKVFVTGHTGFKGSWLCAWLLALKANVTGFSSGVPTEPANFDALKLAGKIRDLRGDVRDRGALARAIRESRPDVVFHLAAQALVRQSYQNPVATFETNVLGTVNLLDACRHVDSLRAVVVITSDKCYRNEEWVWGYRENDRLGGHDPYSASKGCAELAAHSYFDSFFETGPSCATVRAGNVIGGGDWSADRIVPDCFRAWSAGKPVEIRSPNATRPWQHVLEPLSGYLWLGAVLLKGDYHGFNPAGESFNFGPSADASHSVAEVVKALTPFWSGFSSKMDESDSGAMKECGLLKLCCDKALGRLDWKAALNFEETTRLTAEWYARFHSSKGAGMWDYTLDQIAAYADTARARGLEWSLA